MGAHGGHARRGPGIRDFADAMRAAAAAARATGSRPPVPDAMPFRPSGHAVRLAVATYAPLAGLANGELEPLDESIAAFTP